MHVPVVTKIQSAPPWHSSPYKVGISRTYEYLLYVMKAVIFLLLAVVFTIAPIAQAEDDIVTEVLSQGGIPGLIKHYRKIVAQIAKGGANVAAPLNMLMTKIRQKSKLRIDTYHAHWRWHGTYDTCKDEYEGVLQYLRNILDTGGSITSATIESIISQRSCSIWAAVPEQEFFVISELLQRYRQENGSGWNLAKIDEIVEEIASSYDGQTEPIPALVLKVTLFKVFNDLLSVVLCGQGRGPSCAW